MADITKYLDWSWKHGTTEIALVPGTLAAGNDKRTEELVSGKKLAPDLIQVTGKKPFLKATVLDPSVITAWTALGTSTVSTVTATWRSYESNGGLGATYKSCSVAQGVLVPLQLSASATKAATLDLVCYAAFNAGTGITFGTTSTAGGAVTAAYYPTSVTVGGTAVGNVVSVQHSWNYTVQDDDQLEPTYYYHDRYAHSGNAVVKDLSKVTSARLEDGSSETVVLLFTDANNTSATLSVNLGTCKVHAEISGDTGTISWSDLA